MCSECGGVCQEDRHYTEGARGEGGGSSVEGREKGELERQRLSSEGEGDTSASSAGCTSSKGTRMCEGTDGIGSLSLSAGPHRGQRLGNNTGGEGVPKSHMADWLRIGRVLNAHIRSQFSNYIGLQRS